MITRAQQDRHRWGLGSSLQASDAPVVLGAVPCAGLALCLTLLACGPGSTASESRANAMAIRSSTSIGEPRGHLARERAMSVGKNEARASLTVFTQTLICGEIMAEGPLNQVAAGNQVRFLNAVLSKIGEHLRQIGIPLYAQGDTSGSRLRSAAADPERCRAPGTVFISVKLTGGPSRPGNRDIGHPRIIPYTMALMAIQDGKRWITTISRSVDDVHRSVNNDPHTSSLRAATTASVVQDLRDAATVLNQSLRSGNR